MWAIAPGGALDRYLYDCTPVEGCERCEAAAKLLAETEAAGDQRGRYEASSEVRAHPHHTKTVS